MLYKVSELSDLLKVSKQSIYNKIKLKEIEPYVSRSKGITYVSEDGFNLIKEILNVKMPVESDETNDVSNESDILNEVVTTIENKEFQDGFNLDLNYTEDYINTLKSENEKLWLQLQEKDKQISELLLRLEQTSKIVENSQVLLREKVNDPLLLEERFNNFECKLDEVKERMNQRHHEKKSFWDNFRK